MDKRGLTPFLVALLAWFPFAPCWQSDDFIAVHYATDLSRVLRDFTGNQYGLEGLVWFYRPLVTLSFWCDGVLAGRDPELWCTVAHVSNALAHALSALLLQRLLGRFVPAAIATWAAVLWAVSPSHAGAILWAVGRVDAHATVWILLCALAFVRWQEGTQRTRALALGAQVLALMTKELALVLPGIVLVLGCALGPPGARLRAALRGVWPFVVVQILYLGWRYYLFGRLIGGYEGATTAHAGMAGGLLAWTWYLLSPLAAPLVEVPRLFAWLGLAPAAIGAWIAVRSGRSRLLLACLLLFVGCALPAFQFWPHTQDPKNLRYFYLAFAALAPILALGGARTAVPVLLLLIAPWYVVRSAYAAGPGNPISRRAEQLPAGPVLVEDLLRATQIAVYYHLGVDRMTMPPFGRGRQRPFAFRPLVDRPDPFRPGEIAAIPGFTPMVAWETQSRSRARSRIERCEAVLDGPERWTSQLFWDLHRERTQAAFVIRGLRAPSYRITVFTAGGYLTAVCADEAAPGSADGRVRYQSWLAGRTAGQGEDARMAFGLVTPTVLDLDTRFPVFVEAGGGTPFAATHAARSLLWIEFERDFAEWAHGRVADRRGGD